MRVDTRRFLNRVAIPDKNAKARAGGLEVAVKAALKQKSGIWFGWSGKVATRTKIDTQRVMHDGITYITLDLSKEDHHEYYNGFTNHGRAYSGCEVWQNITSLIIGATPTRILARSPQVVV